MESDKDLVLSSLHHTWILDLDGTLVKHNGYKLEGRDTFLEGAEKFLCSLPKEDMVILLTSRKSEYAQQTIEFLKQHHIRYDHIIFDVPYGERIVLNDRKPSGLSTAVAVNPKRDKFWNGKIVIDEEL